MKISFEEIIRYIINKKGYGYNAYLIDYNVFLSDNQEYGWCYIALDDCYKDKIPDLSKKINDVCIALYNKPMRIKFFIGVKDN